MKVRIESVYTLNQPLIHGGDVESNVSFFNTVRIRNGAEVTECAAVTGNALRGTWRDHGAMYLLDRLGIKVPKTAFNLLFSGGSISGPQVLDVSQAKQIRELVPLVSVFGGGIGSQLLQGKFTQTFAYPVCAETTHVIPDNVPGVDYSTRDISWRKLTGQIELSRKDDSKDILANEYMGDENKPDDVADDAAKQPKTRKKAKGGKNDDSDAPATQMRIENEYLVPGTQLWHSLLFDGTQIELGALTSCLCHWAQNPSIGGKSAAGFGNVSLDMYTVNADGVREHFFSVNNETVTLSPLARDAKLAYDELLDKVCDLYAAQDFAPIISLLEGARNVGD